MLQFKTHKYRIHPTVEQKVLLRKNFGACRWLYNHLLDEQIKRFESGQKFLSWVDMNNMIPELKKNPELCWLKEVDSQALKQSAINLNSAYQNFFKSVSGKRKGPKISQPRFKSKSNNQSYRTTQSIKISFESGMIHLPKLKWIKASIDHKFQATIKFATVVLDADGKFYVALTCEEEVSLRTQTGREVGIDLGVANVAILSSGEKFVHPDILTKKLKAKLKREQRKFSRKQKGSKNKEKQRIKVARLYSKITRIKKDYYHNLSAFIVRNNDSIYMENLNISGMAKNHCLSRKIYSASWATLIDMIAYKSNWAGRTLHKIDRWYPSSKTCSCCGYKLESLSLGVREWDCPSCGTHHDRDINAAKNIKNKGQLDCYEKLISDTATEKAKLPMAMMKFVDKIERSTNPLLAEGCSKQLTGHSSLPHKAMGLSDQLR